MKTKDHKNIEMFRNVASIFDENKDKWSRVSELKNTIEKFVDNTEIIEQLQKEIDKDIAPELHEKSAKKEQLINQALPVGNLLQVFAFDLKNKSLAKKSAVSRKKLNKMKDSELVNKCSKIAKTARMYYDKAVETADHPTQNAGKTKSKKNNITSYGVTVEMLNELETSILQYTEAILELKDKVLVKNKNLNKITNKIKANKKILKKKLDKYMMLFETSKNDFFNKYKASRKKSEKEQTKKEEKKIKQKEKKTEPAKPEKEVKEKEEVEETKEVATNS
jgi:hypothetical protein